MQALTLLRKAQPPPRAPQLPPHGSLCKLYLLHVSTHPHGGRLKGFAFRVVGHPCLDVHVPSNLGTGASFMSGCHPNTFSGEGSVEVSFLSFFQLGIFAFLIAVC